MKLKLDLIKKIQIEFKSLNNNLGFDPNSYSHVSYGYLPSFRNISGSTIGMSYRHKVLDLIEFSKSQRHKKLYPFRYK